MNIDHNGFNEFKERGIHELVIDIQLRVRAYEKRIENLEIENKMLEEKLKEAEATPYATRSGSK